MSYSDSSDLGNQEAIIKQIGEDQEPLITASQAISGSIIDQIHHDVRDRINPSLNNDSQPLYSRPFGITKSKSFSILQQKEDEQCNNNFLSGDDDSNFTSIYVTHFNPEKKNEENSSKRGQLTFEDNNLVFLSEDEMNDIQIPLIGHIESALMPHPSNFKAEGSRSLRLLSLTYLPDIKKVSEFLSIYFAADQKILRPFLLFLISKAQNIQREQKFKPPNLKIINTPDFLNYGISNNPTVKKTEQKYLYKNARLPPLPKPKIMPKIKMNGESSILKEEDTLSIRKAFPIRYQSSEWNLLFKLSNDGCSYLTFYHKIEEEDPIVLVLTSDSGDRIGAYLPTPLKPSTHYYGSVDSFVFQLDPSFSTYKWSKSNQYFISSTREELSIGGGGNSAIWVDGYFNKAFSGDCSTFNSPQLTKKPHFSISEVEVWKIGHLKKNHATANKISNRY